MIPQASNQFPSMFTFLQSRADLSSLNYNASFVQPSVVFNPIPQYDSSQQCNNYSNIQPPANSIKMRLRPRNYNKLPIKKIGRKRVVPILPKPENYDIQQQNKADTNNSSEDAKKRRKRRIFIENRHDYTEVKYAKYIKKARKQGHYFKLNAQDIPKFEVPKIEMFEKSEFTNKELSQMSFKDKIYIKFCCSSCKTELPLCLFGIKCNGTPLNTCVKCCMKKCMANPNINENIELIKEYKEIIRMYNEELEIIKKSSDYGNSNNDSPEETVVAEVVDDEEENKRKSATPIQEEVMRKEKIQLLLQKSKELERHNYKNKGSGYIPKRHYYRKRYSKPTEEDLKREKQIQELLKQIIPLPKVNNNNNNNNNNSLPSNKEEKQQHEEEDQQQELIQIPLPLPIQQFPSEDQHNSNPPLIDSQFTALTPIQPQPQQLQYQISFQLPPQQQSPPPQQQQPQPQPQQPQQQPQQQQPQQQQQQQQQQSAEEEQQKKNRFPTCYKPEKTYYEKSITRENNIKCESQVDEILRYFLPHPMTFPLLDNKNFQSAIASFASQLKQKSRQPKSSYYKVIVKQKVELKDEATNTEESETMKIIYALKELDEKKAMKNQQNNKQQQQQQEIIQVEEEREKQESNTEDKQFNDEVHAECSEKIKIMIQHPIIRPSAMKPKSMTPLLPSIPVLLPILPTLPLQPLPTTIISPPLQLSPPPTQISTQTSRKREQLGPIPLPPSPTLITTEEETFMPELDINPNFVDDGLIHLPPQVYSDLSPVETDIETN